MSDRPVFPPLYRSFAVTPEIDPFERCVSVAADGAEPGTLLWSIGQEACECAIALAPEQSLEASLPVALVAMLGLGDALGSIAPQPTSPPDKSGVDTGCLMPPAPLAGAVPGWPD